MNKVSKILESMKARGLQPNRRTFSSAINACAKSGDVGAAVRFLQEMEQMGLEPDVVTFGSLIDACAKAARQDVDKVSEILELMKARGLKPNKVTKNI